MIKGLTGILIVLILLFIGGFALSIKRRRLDFWPWGFAIGSTLFLVSFHITRFLLNISFPASAIITLSILVAVSLIGLFRMEPRLRPPSKGFKWAFTVSVILLALFPGASWDQGHHIPGVQDILRGIHPLHIASGVRPGVTGGFYHYGVEALAAVSLFISGGSSVKMVFRLIDLVAGAASFWVLYMIIRDFFSRDAAITGTLTFFWAGNFFVLLNLGRLISGSGWHEVPKLVFYGEFARGGAPFPGYFFQVFHPPMALGFPIFLIAIWLILRGGKTRAILSGLILGPLALAHMALSVTLLGVLFLYPILRRFIAKAWEIREWGLSLAGGMASFSLLGLPFLLFRNQGLGLKLGPFWTVTLELQRDIPLLVGAPFIFLGIPLILLLFWMFK